ncbi:MAG: hypothetical protein AB8B87_13970 [Granulosicoccus sp.]
MKVCLFTQPNGSLQLRTIGISMGLLLLSSFAFAQNKSMSVEELEQLVAEQRIALEEAIANREDTAAQVESIRSELEEVRNRSLEVEEELESLCKEQESITNESFVKCMASVSD